MKKILLSIAVFATLVQAQSVVKYDNRNKNIDKDKVYYDFKSKKVNKKNEKNLDKPNHPNKRLYKK